MRLQKYLASCGVASRRAAEALIADGHVSVDGRTVTEMGVQVEIGQDIRVDGKLVTPEPEKRYIMYHKPAGEVSTASDPEGRTTVLDKFRGTGWKKVYLIFGMCDESFSINYTADIPENVDRGWFMFFVTLLNHFYWFSGATLGGIFGSLIHFNTEGLDFVMTAMFVVIFMEQWLKEKNYTSSILGLGISLLCLIAFGADNFIIPAMLALLVVLTLMRRPLEKEGEVQ